MEHETQIVLYKCTNIHHYISNQTADLIRHRGYSRTDVCCEYSRHELTI
jgi:hypothetical protein